MTTYVVNFTDVNVTPITVPEAGLNVTATDIALFGRTRLEYGELLNENLLHILENFACPENPGAPNTPDLNRTHNNLLVAPTPGQLWYNSTTSAIHYWTGTYWIPIRKGGDVAANWGSVVNGQTLPRPVSASTGYVFNYDECIWSVSSANYNTFFGEVICESDPVTSQVTMRYRVGGQFVPGIANYLIIGIRNNSLLGGIQPTPSPTSAAPTPSNSPAPSSTRTPTPTPSTTASAGQTPTPTPAITSSPTRTPTPTPTRTGTPAPTGTPTRTPNISQSTTPTRTPAPTASRTPTPTPSTTPSATPPTQNTWTSAQWFPVASDFGNDAEAAAIVRILSTGVAQGVAWSQSFGEQIQHQENWHSGAPTAGDPQDYQVRLTLLSGSAPDAGGPAVSVWHRLNTSRIWELRVIDTPGPGTPPPKVAQWLIDIRKAPIGEPAQGAVTKLVTLEATVEEIE